MGIGDDQLLLARGADQDAPYFKGSDRGYRLEPWHDALEPWAPDLWIDANPQRDSVSGWVGHLLNDAATCAGGSDAEILQYYETGCKECNCVMIPCGEAAPLMAVYTLRPVDRGEELLFSYGHDYWLSALGLEVPPYS